MNTNPIHFDDHFASQSQHGRCLVNGTLVFSIVVGMSVRDISQTAIANLEYEFVRHLGPTFHGDTLYAESEILEKTESRRSTIAASSTSRRARCNQRDEPVDVAAAAASCCRAARREPCSRSARWRRFVARYVESARRPIRSPRTSSPALDARRAGDRRREPIAPPVSAREAAPHGGRRRSAAWLAPRRERASSRRAPRAAASRPAGA